MPQRDPRLTFYEDTLREQITDRSSNVLVLAAGPRDRQVFDELGFSNVTFSNVDRTYGGSDDFKPHAFIEQDAENLQIGNGAFDFVVIHAALHHCHSPHRALLEMYRVARVGVLVFEARDSALMRLLERHAMTETYEQRGVYFNGGGFGGVRNGPVPNFIYRWTEREVEKTINSFAPHVRHRFDYSYGHDAPAALLYPGPKLRKNVLRMAYAVYRVFARVAPRQQNLFAFFVAKGGLQPWVSDRQGQLMLDMDWGRAKFDR